MGPEGRGGLLTNCAKPEVVRGGPDPIGANQASLSSSTLKSSGQLETFPDLAKVAEALEGLKAGRTLSAKNEQRVRDIARLSQELLGLPPPQRRRTAGR